MKQSEVFMVEIDYGTHKTRMTPEAFIDLNGRGNTVIKQHRTGRLKVSYIMHDGTVQTPG